MFQNAGWICLPPMTISNEVTWPLPVRQTQLYSHSKMKCESENHIYTVHLGEYTCLKVQCWHECDPQTISDLVDFQHREFLPMYSGC